MFNASESIVVGVVSGIITSIVIWIMIRIFEKIIVPWYQSITYAGAIINGDWLGFFISNALKEAEDPAMQISLEQKGHRVKGEIILVKNLSGKQDPKILVLEGQFKDGNLNLSYSAKDKTRMGLGSYILKLEKDGKILSGKSLYISSNKGSVSVTDLYWKRREN